MMLTYHISHEKIFSTALYVHGRSGVNIYDKTLVIQTTQDENNAQCHRNCPISLDPEI